MIAELILSRGRQYKKHAPFIVIVASFIAFKIKKPTIINVGFFN